MAKLYADEDFDYPVVEELRRLGHDVVTVQEAGQAGAADPQVLTHAISQGRCVVTYNHRHFRRLHGQSSAHHGIISCTYDRDPVALAGRIDRAIANYPSLDAQLIRVVRPPP